MKETDVKQFLKGMEQISRASKKIIELSKKITDIEAMLSAEEQYHDLQIKPFGDGGSHIVITGNSHVGKTTNVIVKRGKGG